MGPTPTDDEMRRANEWYMATYPNSAKFMPNASAYRPIRDAYAAALAECRGQVEAERERLAKMAETEAETYAMDGRKCDAAGNTTGGGHSAASAIALRNFAAAIRGGGQ